MEESEDLSAKKTVGEEPINISGGVDLGQEHKDPEGMDPPLVPERQVDDTGAIFNEEINGEDDELSFGSFQSEATSVTASSVKGASEIKSNEPLSTENHLSAPDPEAKLNPRSGEDIDCVQNEDEIAHVEIDDGNDELDDFGDFNDGHSNFQEHDHANIESRQEQDTHIMDQTESLQVDHDCKAKSAAVKNIDVEESPGTIQDSFFVEEVEATTNGECNNYSHGHNIEPTSSHDVFDEFQEFIENDFESNIAESNGTSSIIDACITSSDNNDIDVHPSSVHLDVTDACDEPNLEEMKTRSDNDNTQELDTNSNLVNDKNNEKTNEKKNCNDAILFDDLDDFGESNNLPHSDAKSNESEECGNEANGLSLEENNNITNTKLDHVYVPYQDYSEFKDTSLPGSDKIQGNDLDSSIDFHEKQDIVMKNEVNDGSDKVPNLNDNNASIESIETNNEDIKSTGIDEENSRFGVEAVHVDDHNLYDIAPAANDETLVKFDDSLPTRNAEDDKDIADAKETLEEEIICSDDYSFGDVGEPDNTTSRTKDHDSKENREAMDSNDENHSNDYTPVSTHVDKDDDCDDDDDFGDFEAMNSNDENHSNSDEPGSTQVDKDDDCDDDDDFGDFEAMDSNDENHSNGDEPVSTQVDDDHDDDDDFGAFETMDTNDENHSNSDEPVSTQVDVVVDDDDDFGDFEAMNSNDENHSNSDEPVSTQVDKDVFGAFEAMDTNDENHNNIEAATDASTSDKEPIETSSGADVTEGEENDNDDDDDDDDFGDFEAMDTNDEGHSNIEAATDASTSDKEPIETSSGADVTEGEENGNDDDDDDDDDDFGAFEAIDSNDENHSNGDEPVSTQVDVVDDDDDDFGDFEAMDSNDENHSNSDEPVSTQVDVVVDDDDDFGDFEAMNSNDENHSNSDEPVSTQVDKDVFGAFEAMDTNDENHNNIEAATDASTSDKEPIETSSGADVTEGEENDNDDDDDDDDFGDFEAMDTNDEGHSNIEAATDASTSDKEPIETSSGADVTEGEENGNDDDDDDDDDDFGAFEAIDSNDENHSNGDEPVSTQVDVVDDDDDDFGDFEAMDSNDENHSNSDEPVSSQVDDDDDDDDFGDFEAMGKSEEDGHVDVLGKGTECLIESAFVQSAFNRITSLFRSEDIVVPIHNTGYSLTTCQNLLDVMTDITVQQKEQLAESTSLHLHLSKLFDHTSTKDTPSNVFIDDRDQIWRYENELNVGGFQIDQKDDVEKALYDLVNVDLPTLAEIAADEEEELDQIHQETVEKEKPISSFKHQGDLQTDTANAGKFNQDLSTDTSPLPNNPTIVAIPSRKKGESQSLYNGNSPNGDIFSAFDNAFESIDHAPPNDFHESEVENSFGDFNSTPAIQETSLSLPVSNGKDDLFGAFSVPRAAPETEYVNDADAEAFGTFSRSPMPSEVLSLPKSDPSIAAPTLVADIPNDDDDDDDNFAAFHTSSNNGQESLPTADNHFEVPVSTNDAEIPSMLPPPAMNDVDFKSDNIVDFQNNNDDGSEDNDEDGFGAFNALSSSTAEAVVVAPGAAEIPSIPASMPPPPAMDDVDAKSDIIVDIQNDDEDGFGAFNALSSDLAAAVEIPSMPMSMPPPPAMYDVDVKSDNIVGALDNDDIEDDENGFGAFNALSSSTTTTAETPSMPMSMPPPPDIDDVELKSDNIVDAVNNDYDDEDGFGAFNALSSSTTTAEIPSMPMSMPPPPTMDDVGLKSDIVDAVNNDYDDEDGFGAFNALSSSSAPPPPGAAEIPSIHASILPSAVFSPTMNEVNTNHSTQDDGFGAFDSVSRTAESLLVPSQTNNLPSQFNFNNGNMINTLETEKNMYPESNNFDSDDDFGDFSCSQDVTSSQKIDPFLGFDRSVQMTSNTYASNSHTQSETTNSNAVTNGDYDDDFGDFSSAGMNMSSGSTNAITDAFSIFD